MSDEYELLPTTVLRDLADRCGRNHWRAEAPLAASTLYIQRSRVENYRVVSGLIRERSDIMHDERTRKAVWAAVCQAVDVHLAEPGTGAEVGRTLAALLIADRPDAEFELAKFTCHRMAGGTKTWAQWMGIDAPWEVADGR